MRRTLTVITVVILSLVQALPGQTVDYSKKPLQSERSRSYDALHYLVKIALDLERKSFAGTATVTASSFMEGLEACVLDAEEFAVSSVVDEYGAPLRFEQSDKELKVFLARPAKSGEIVTFTCRYDGREPRQGLKFVDETPDNPRLVWSDSWPDNVHHWFPCFDYPNDKATSEIVATVKAGLKVASNGRLVGVTEDAAAGTVTYHWSQELPHSTYLIFLAAAPYVVVRDSYRTLPVNYWVYPGDEAKARPTYGKTPGDDRVLQRDLRIRLSLAEVRPDLGPARRRRREHVGHGDDAADHGRGGGRAGFLRHRDRLPRAGPSMVGRPHHPPQLGPRLDERELRDVLGLPVSPPRQRRRRRGGQPPEQARRLPPGGQDPLHPPDRLRPLRQAGGHVRLAQLSQGGAGPAHAQGHPRR